MGQKLPPKELALYKLIDELLVTEWDPCGVNRVAEAWDEYYGYLPQIFRLALDGASPRVIAKHLLSIERDRMGLRGDRRLCLRVAAKIVNAKEVLGL
jgi:hypothetical protein